MFEIVLKLMFYIYVSPFSFKSTEFLFDFSLLCYVIPGFCKLCGKTLIMLLCLVFCISCVSFIAHLLLLFARLCVRSHMCVCVCVCSFLMFTSDCCCFSVDINLECMCENEHFKCCQCVKHFN